MPRTIRFYIDENVRRYKGIAKALRLRGIDVVTPLEANLRTAEDPTHWQYVNANRLVLLTTDEDFLSTGSRQPHHPGIVYYKQGERTIGQVINYLALIWELLDPEDIEGKVEFVPLG
jgi:predicted nuclease of predicted toxin-antitoxin system